MKTEITQLCLGNGLDRYIVRYKEHWWSRWHYIMGGKHPRLFTSEEIESFEEIESLRKHKVLP